MCQGLQENEAHLTARMQPAAAMGFCFQRSSGTSVEYAMPSSRLPTSVAISGGDPASPPSTSAAAPAPATCAGRQCACQRLPDSCLLHMGVLPLAWASK